MMLLISDMIQWLYSLTYIVRLMTLSFDQQVKYKLNSAAVILIISLTLTLLLVSHLYQENNTKVCKLWT